MNTATIAPWVHDDTELARLALQCLDLTELGEACTVADVDAVCAKARGQLPGAAGTEVPPLPPVAAVCVWPQFVAQARHRLPAHIRVAAVVNFPAGTDTVPVTCAQVAQIREGGGQEVDCVLPHRAWMAGDRAAARTLVRAVRQASHGLTLKLILESGAFGDLAELRAACDMALDEGVDFLKTSTGKIAQGASLPAAEVLLAALSRHPDAARLGFKPSGGLRTVTDVRPYALALARHLGASAAVPSRFRIGASGLWTDIARHLAGPAGTGAANPSPSAY